MTLYFCAWFLTVYGTLVYEYDIVPNVQMFIYFLFPRLTARLILSVIE